MKTTITFLALFVLCAVSHAQQQDEYNIKSIAVQGNVSTDSSLIVATSRLKVGDRITSAGIQDAINKLYILGIFSDIKIESKGQTLDGIYLLIIVDEYPVIKDIKIEGNEEIDLKKIQTKINLVKGQVVSPLDIKRAKEKIVKLYKEKGFYLAQVEVNKKSDNDNKKVSLELKIHEGKKVAVETISLIGNHSVSGKKIRKIMKTKEKRWWRKAEFKTKEFNKDLETLPAYYSTLGYRDAAVKEHSFSFDKTGKKMHIAIEVEEGQRYSMGTAAWEGYTVYSTKEIERSFMQDDGDIFNEGKYQQSLMNLYALYQEKGYIYVSIDPVEENNDSIVNVTYKITEGQPALVSNIFITGNTKTKERVIRRELVLTPGDIFKRSLLDRSQREVYQLNFFQDIKVDYQETENGKIDIIFKVEEKPSGRASIGAGFGSDGLVGTIGLATPNLGGNGQSIDFNWDFGQEQNRFEVGFTEPWLFYSPTSLGVSFFDINRSDVYRTEFLFKRRTGGSIRIGRTKLEKFDYVKLFSRYTLEKVVVIENDVDVTKWLSSIGLTVIRDDRDLPEFANKGTMNSYALQVAGGILSGDEEFQKHVLTLNSYYPTFWKLVLNPRFSLGYITGLNDPDNVPIREKFRPGGRSFDGDIRGYENERDALIVPLDKFGRPGGRAMAVFNLEYRFPIIEKQFYAFTFFDAGRAWEKLEQVNIFDVTKSVGVGVRFVVPMMGTIGFDFGYALDKQTDRWKTHFQFGRVF